MAGGLYNVLFGTHPTARMVEEALGIRREPPAFRDAWYDGRTDELVVYARLDWFDRGLELGSGGQIDLLDLPGFLGFEMDDYDPSYGFFRYEVPFRYRHEFNILRENGYGGAPNPAKRWRDLFKAIARGDVDDPVVRRALSLRCFAKRHRGEARGRVGHRAAGR